MENQTSETATTPDSKKESGVLMRGLQKVFDQVIEVDSVAIRDYVAKLKELNPGISQDDLARKIVSRKAMKNGLVGAVTGAPGIFALPVTVPADVVWSWRIQADMVFAVAQVYGFTGSMADLRTDLYIILAGNSAKEALKRVGIVVGAALTRRVVERVVTRQVMKKVWVVVGRQIVTKAGTKSLTSFMKWVPLIGAPIGFLFDWTTTKAVGNYAIKYYSGRA